MARQPLITALGIDAGSVSLELCLLDRSGSVLASTVSVVQGDTRAALRTALEKIRRSRPGAVVEACCATGSGRSLVAEILGCGTVNEITAHALGTATAMPDDVLASIIEIGGQDSKFIQVRKTGGRVDVLDHAMNTLCAAGTGTFFDGLAKHLGVTTEKLAHLADRAGSHVHVAGRCAVFSRSDLIHLCQKGVALEEIALGICHAAARNVAGTVVRHRPVHDPLYFTGGVAANRGMARALRDLFGLGQGLPVVPRHYRIFGAMGAALHAAEAQGFAEDTLRGLAERARFTDCVKAPRRPRVTRRAAAVLTPGTRSGRSLGLCASDRARSSAGKPGRPSRLYIGLDVGSTSVKWAVTDGRDRVYDYWYGFTQGNPASALKTAAQALAHSRALRSQDEDILSRLCVTGSGRKFSAAMLGRGRTVNEVSAMVQAARLLSARVDTIFEIGGQDAKYVRLERGIVQDFALNIACSAGTGSLLIDEAARFGVDMETLDRLALACGKPAPIHSRCNVFMDSDLVYHMQSGESLENIAGGLMKAVASNYLEKVVEKRPVGSAVVFLGGVSRLASMVKNLEAMTGKPLRAPWWGFISGAVGAAGQARLVDETETRKRRAPRRAERPAGRVPIVFPEIIGKPSQSSCKGCGQGCTITKIQVAPAQAGQKPRSLFTGDGCGRFDALNREGKDPGPPGAVPDPAAAERGMDRPSAGPGMIGVPRSQQFFEIGAFIAGLLDELGIPWGYSKKTTPIMIQRGEQLAPAQHCIPIKTAIAHCESLMKEEAAALFVPEIIRVDHGGRAFKLCVYSQQLASFVRVSLDREAARRNTPILSPKIMLSPHRRGATCEALHQALESFRVSPGDVERAFDRGLAAYVEFKASLSERGHEALRGADAKRPAVVLFGRPYSIHDPALNLQIARRLERLGVTVITYDAVTGCLPQEDESTTPWLLGDEQIRAAAAVARFPHAYPLGITYYGCGVDAFLSKHLEDRVGRDRPFLQIELDGHGAEAGLETRLEAFVDQIRTRGRPMKGEAFTFREQTPAAEILKEKTIAMPYVAPHVHAFAAVFQRLGWNAQVLPEPDDEVRLLGERFSNGRECNPYFYLVGDLIRWARNGDLTPEQKIFFIPTSSQSSCLISQYGKGFKAALEEAGVRGLTVWTPTGAELMDMFSLEEKKLLWIGLLGIDYVFRLSASMSPYEKERGRTWSTFRLCLDEIRRGMAAGDASGAVKRAAAMMEAVERSEPAAGRPRLRIGIIGDVYTRINAFANQSLYEVLESMGCEVLAPSFLVDLLLYDMAHDVRRKAQGGSLALAARRAAVSVYQWAVWNYVRSMFPLDGRILRDGDMLWGPGDAWYSEASKYLNVETEGLLAQNIGKAVDHVRNGAEGIINVMCHGCMIGTATEAVLGKVSESFESMPVLSLSYDSLGDVHTRTRLEAFIELCRAWRKRRDREEGARPDRGLSAFLF